MRYTDNPAYAKIFPPNEKEQVERAVAKWNKFYGTSFVAKIGKNSNGSIYVSIHQNGHLIGWFRR